MCLWACMSAALPKRTLLVRLSYVRLVFLIINSSGIEFTGGTDKEDCNISKSFEEMDFPYPLSRFHSQSLYGCSTAYVPQPMFHCTMFHSRFISAAGVWPLSDLWATRMTSAGDWPAPPSQLQIGFHLQRNPAGLLWQDNKASRVLIAVVIVRRWSMATRSRSILLDRCYLHSACHLCCKIDAKSQSSR